MDQIEQSAAWLEFPSGERITLPGICTVGRGPENRVVIASERVSRRHATIRQTATGSYMLMDMGSSNGTFLNGQRLAQSTELRDGSVIEIGSQKMTFRVPVAAINESGEETTRECECWLLIIAGAQRGLHTPSQELIDKTQEHWTARCQRVVLKYRGRIMRGRGDTLLAFWPDNGQESVASTVATCLRSLLTLQKQTEEFRFAMHHGHVNLRQSATGEEAPIGPDVITLMQLDRLASMFNCSLLITESASLRLGDALPNRKLTNQEVRGYRGAMRFYTPLSS